MSEPPTPVPGVPPVLGFLTPARREELRQAYAARLAAGDNERRIVGDLAMRHGIAPSFVRIVLGQAEG